LPTFFYFQVFFSGYTLRMRNVSQGARCWLLLVWPKYANLLASRQL